ncbi:hypothetical protein [Clostridium tetani]|uniref:hypothetical protein n=1 Tax=Clostridium tetani TaxID=1513 RepID=UPI000513F478|nr:hypothetical protein [Clostridium tetani]KGI36902.1 hypothetical protein LA33_12330 [Clostridium tetani ATCC 9441]SUY82480.1 Uncharacterised protein [Clostridium tetani]
MTKKKRILSIICICVLGVISIAASNYYKAPKNDTEKAQYMKLLKDKNKNSKILVKVGNEAITENDLKVAKIFNDNNLSDDQLLDKLIRDKILIIEGKKQNLIPSNEEVINRVNEVKNQVEKFPDAIEKIKNYKSGLKVSDDEYWNNIVFNEYKNRITINNLIKKENNKYKNENTTKNLIDNSKDESYKQTIDRVYDNLKQNYHIQLLK